MRCMKHSLDHILFPLSLFRVSLVSSYIQKMTSRFLQQFQLTNTFPPYLLLLQRPSQVILDLLVSVPIKTTSASRIEFLTFCAKGSSVTVSSFGIKLYAKERTFISGVIDLSRFFRISTFFLPTSPEANENTRFKIS